MTDILTILSGASANVTGGAFDTGDLKDGAALEVTTAGTVAAFSVQLQGSMDGVNWVGIGSPLTTATTSAELTGFLARWFRAVLSGFSGTGTVSARIGVETGAGFPSLTQLDARYSLPSGTQAAGLSSIATGPSSAAWQQPALSELYRFNAGVTGSTIPRFAATNGGLAPASGTLYAASIVLPQGVPVNTITFCTGTTGVVEIGGSHGWYVLMDSSRVVRAVTADQTAATFWGAGNNNYPLSVSASAYTTTYTGLYYLGICIVATTMPVFSGGVAVNSIANAGVVGPVLSGVSSSTGQTTPPALGTTMGALTAGSFNFFAFTA